jgi:hypothetical protein
MGGWRQAGQSRGQLGQRLAGDKDLAHDDQAQSGQEHDPDDEDGYHDK